MEIKFRSWDRRNKRMGLEDLTFAIGRMSERAGHTEYDLMQFTGLLDKNGKELYVGDLVEQGERVYEVIFGDGGFYIAYNGITSALPAIMLTAMKGTPDYKEWEIIGNIYEK